MYLRGKSVVIVIVGVAAGLALTGFSAMAQQGGAPPAAAAAAPGPAPAAPPAAGRGGAPGGGCGTFRSFEQLPDSRVTFRLCAPNATTVAVSSPDLTVARGITMTKADNGLWSGTSTQPSVPMAFRYTFTVNGVPVVDPQAIQVADTSTGYRGVQQVTGPSAEFMMFHPDIPHGTLATVYYQSKAIGQKLRMQIYTPPGYEAAGNSKKYPVLYIRHGAGDDDTDWMTVGRLPEILDNLIAAGKAVPMIVVSPTEPPPIPGAGRGGAAPAAAPAAPGATPAPAPAAGFVAAKATGVGKPVAGDRFGTDLFGDIVPYVESHYRVLAHADHRAMAGLSMGGAATVNNGLPNPQFFHYIGIFSISLNNAAIYETRVGEALTRGVKDLKLLYFACGNADMTITDHGAALMAELDKYHFNYVKNISEGGHTWVNWREYLNDFAPRLFKGRVTA